MAFGDPSYIVNGKILREEYPAYSYSENVGNAVVTTIYLAPAGEYYEQWELVIIYDINNNYSRTYISTSSDITGEYEFQIDSGDFSIPPG